MDNISERNPCVSRKYVHLCLREFIGFNSVMNKERDAKYCYAPKTS